MLSDIQLIAMQASMRVALLDLTFSSGFAKIKSGPNEEMQSLAGKHMKMRISVNTYRTTLTNVGRERYSVHLEIKDDNAIVPSEGNSGISFPQLNPQMQNMFEGSLTTILKGVLRKGNRYKLLEFEVPIPDPNSLSIIGELIPKDIDYTFYYDGPNSVDTAFGVLMSPPNTDADESDTARGFTKHELTPAGVDFAMNIDSQIIMSFIRKTLIQQSIFQGYSNPLTISNECPARLEYNSDSDVSVETMSLEEFDVKIIDQLTVEIFAKLWKNSIAPGVNLEAWTTLRFQLQYDSVTKSLKPYITHASQDHKTHKKWWSHYINVLSLGLFHGAVDIIVGNKMKDRLVDAMTVNVRGVDMPMNVGGALGDVLDHLLVTGLFFDVNGNLVFNLKVTL